MLIKKCPLNAWDDCSENCAWWDSEDDCCCMFKLSEICWRLENLNNK